MKISTNYFHSLNPLEEEFYDYIKHMILTLFRMGFFGAAHGWGSKKPPLPKICRRYPTMMKLGKVIPYPKKIQKNI